MSEEDKHKLSKILYYSNIHPADTEFINNIIYDLQEENERLKTNWQVAQEDLEHILKLLGLELGDTIYDIENKIFCKISAKKS